jgi:RNA polymerase sigma factor (sigma-70 family)
MADRCATAELREQPPDAVLAAGFRRDPDLFTCVYERYFGAIYRYVAGRLDVRIADDIAAETFLVAFGQRDRFDPARGSLRAWLFGIATNLVARYRRAEARHYAALARAVPEPAIASHEARVVASVAAASMRAQLARALAELSPGERDVVLLVALGQLSHEEVAHALGISAGTVGSRLSRARAKLHRAIDREAFDG